MHSDRIFALLTIFPFDFISEDGGDLVCSSGERKSWERHGCDRKRVFGDLEAKLNSNIPTSFWMNKMDE
jgi:hypothetical protein